MLTRNNLNPEKSTPDKIQGKYFFLFISDSMTTTLFDSEMGSPIYWGTKSEILLQMARKLPELCKFRTITIDFYKWVGGKFTWKGSYKGPNIEERIRAFTHRLSV